MLLVTVLVFRAYFRLWLNLALFTIRYAAINNAVLLIAQLKNKYT